MVDEPGFAWLDKSQSVLQLPDRFRQLLLRPPRFGKTTLLSLLQYYYDIREAENYTKNFGSLAVAADLNHRHNQHLCLSFQLSHMAVISELDVFIKFFNADISAVLYEFVYKYASELEVASVDAFIASHEKNLLGSTLASAPTRTGT